jgi:glycogen phosphorylase
LSNLDSELLFTPIPQRIGRLRELAYNLWWAWHPEAQALYARIDPDLWELVYHNPVEFLRDVRQRKLDAVADDQAFLKHYDAVLASFDAYMSDTQTWWQRSYGSDHSGTIAYFSAEFGLHESLPIYSGGLGVLSGDHVKEASDLGLPFVCVGFIYPQGYFRQRLDPSGWQNAEYTKVNFADIPARPAFTKDGQEVVVEVELPGRTIYAKAYTIQVGRVQLVLLDTDIHPNSPQDRELSARLYGGDHEIRISQEIVLGIGGVRALRELGIAPTVWHMNEGHSAFLVLELAREQVRAGQSFDKAAEVIRRHAIFTTHTPVPAGNDAFAYDLIEKYFWRYWGELGLSREQFLGLARDQQPWGELFGMTVLAIHLAERRNGVSQLHGEVARRMWQKLFPNMPSEQVPIGAITNGVHSATWLAPQMREVFDAYLGADWEARVDEPAAWNAIRTMPDNVLWETRKKLKHQLVAFVRERVQARARGLNIGVPGWPNVLDENALIIGFARRFATYKRATLLFKDLGRLSSIVNRQDRPVYFVFAGKAHPADNPGKHFIQDVYQIAQREEFAGKIVFLEEYDMCIGRALTQGVDVWLNNPRRPYEASGTSGMKASLNGAPNLSILDGWWPEAFNGKNGWAIGEEREYSNADEQDWNDAQSLYWLLEHEVAAKYYNRDANGLSREWLAICKEAIATVAPQFSMRRMVKEYVEQLYVPAMGETVAQ